MRVERVVSEPMSVNCWLVEDAGEAMVVDAGLGRDLATLVPALREAARGSPIGRVYLTHLHCDHVGGAAGLRAAFGCEVCIHEREADAVEHGDAVATLGAFLGAKQEPCPVTRVRPGETVRLGDARFEVLELPGHTAASSALWSRADGALFAGDVVFAHGAFGRVDFPGGDARALVTSLRRLAALPVERAYPGHMEPIERNARESIEASLANAETLL